MKKEDIDEATYAIHDNEDYYEKSEELQAQRSLPENKDLPTLILPSLCIGMRFAFLKVKLSLFQCPLSYQFASCDRTSKTPDPSQTFCVQRKSVSLLRLPFDGRRRSNYYFIRK